MDIKEAIRERHSVRQYSSDHILGDVRTSLINLIQECNKESGLHIQLVTDDPECFNTLLGHYGKFSGVNNYIAIVGPKTIKNFDELGGYYGEKIVLKAQMMGLNKRTVKTLQSSRERNAWVAQGRRRSSFIGPNRHEPAEILD